MDEGRVWGLGGRTCFRVSILAPTDQEGSLGPLLPWACPWQRVCAHPCPPAMPSQGDLEERITCPLRAFIYNLEEPRPTK